MPRKTVKRPIRRAKKARPAGKNTRRRLMPGAGAAALIVGYVGRKAYRSYTAYYQALARRNARRQKDNLGVSDNIVNLNTASLTLGKYEKPTLQDKIRDAIEEPTMFRQTHAYRVNADSGRMNWFHTSNLQGGTLLQYFNKMKDSLTDGTVVNPLIQEPVNDPGSGSYPNQFYKNMIKYNSVRYQIMNSCTNSLKGVIMWVRPKRELPATHKDNASLYIKPTNMFALACNAIKPPVDVYSGVNFTQDGATNGFAGLPYTSDFNRAGNSGTINNTGDNVLETDLSLKPTSAGIKEMWGYYFDVIKSTDFDLKPGQQADFWLKQYDCKTTKFQATQFDSIPGVTTYCMIGFQGQMVGTNASTGDVNVVSTGSAQLSIIETHKTIIKPIVYRAPKIWNYTNDGTGADQGVLFAIPDANQEIVNDETDGIDNTYNEAS